MLQALASAERLIKTTAKDVQSKVAGSGWGAGIKMMRRWVRTFYRCGGRMAKRGGGAPAAEAGAGRARPIFARAVTAG